MRDLRKTAQENAGRLRQIKVALFDCDGILTSGALYYQGAEVGYNRMFNARDGYGLKVLMQAGLKVGIITGGNSLGVNKRFSDLKVDYLHMGSEDKREAYLEVQKKSGAKDEEILYMGDEFFDLPLIERAGFGATVPNASIEIQERSNYVTEAKAGEGAAREVIDLLRFAQGIVPEVPGF